MGERHYRKSLLCQNNTGFLVGCSWETVVPATVQTLQRPNGVESLLTSSANREPLQMLVGGVSLPVAKQHTAQPQPHSPKCFCVLQYVSSHDLTLRNRIKNSPQPLRVLCVWSVSSSFSLMMMMKPLPPTPFVHYLTLNKKHLKGIAV